MAIKLETEPQLLKRTIMLSTAGINLYQVAGAMGFPNTYTTDSTVTGYFAPVT